MCVCVCVAREVATLDWVEESAIAQQGPSVLPGFIDDFTQKEVILPAISPQGYVLGYYTWLRVLAKQRNHCPFTRLPVTRRHLVKLTPDNIEEYRDKITNSQTPGSRWGISGAVTTVTVPSPVADAAAAAAAASASAAAANGPTMASCAAVEASA